MLRELCSRAFAQAFLAELLGTMVFVFCGLCSTLLWNVAPATVLQISLTFGLAIGTMVQAVGHISGAHLNPAVTIAFLVGSQISLLRAVFYIIAQLVGAVLGAAVLYEITPSTIHGSFGVNGLSNGTSPGQGVCIELFITMQLILCILGTTDSRRTDNVGFPAISIGLSVTLGHLLGIYFTGCSMNPARSFGPAVITGNFTRHWISWVGPIMGACMAVLMYHYLLSPFNMSSTDKIAVLKGELDSEEEQEHQREGLRKKSVDLHSIYSMARNMSRA